MRNFMIIVLIKMVTLSYSQEMYRTFFLDGKTWIYEHYEYPDSENPLQYTYWTLPHYKVEYRVMGDTIVDNRKVYKVYKCTKDSISLSFCGYEEDGKVFRIDVGQKASKLMYDFSLKPSDESPFVYKDENYNIKRYVSWIDTIQVRNRLYKRIHFTRKGDLVEVDDIWEEKWVEGIGCQDGMFASLPFPASWPEIVIERFVCCYDYENEEVLLTRDDISNDMNIFTSVKTISVDKKWTGRHYDLQGRRVTTPQKNGLYIKNGKKYIAR